MLEENGVHNNFPNKLLMKFYILVNYAGFDELYSAYVSRRGKRDLKSEK